MTTTVDLSLAVRTFFEQHHRSHLEETTAEDYGVQLNHFERYFSAWLAAHDEPPRAPTLCDLSPLHLRGAMDARLDAGRKKGTADKLRRSLLAIWNKGVELSGGQLPAPGKIRGLKTVEHEPVAWTIDELSSILWGASRLPGHVGPFALATWMPALIWVVYNSGLRISATMEIRRTWVNVPSRRLVVQPEVQKDDGGRSVALLPETMEALLPLLANGKEGPFDDWTFDRGVKQWPALTRRLRQAIVLAGLAEKLEHVTRRDLWHKFRRTFATQIYIATSGSIEEVKRRLGHSSIEVSYRYIDWSQVERASEADLLPRPKATTPLRVVRSD